jgi:N-acetylmuramoyl-L-alanine amidase
MRLLILVLLIWSSSFALASSIPAPRIGKYPGYSRVVVDLPPDASYRLELKSLVMRVIFPGGTVVPDLKKFKQAEFSGYTLEQNSDVGVLTLVTPQGVTTRSGWRLQTLSPGEGKIGSRLVIDLSGAFSDTSPLGVVEQFTFKPENLVRTFSVVLDPGHGGTDPGARGVVTEAEVNLSVSTRVAQTLSEAGVEVTLTRTDNSVFSDNKQLDLRARADLATGKDLFVAIHANARPPSNALTTYGTEVYYYNAKSQVPVLVTPANPPKLAGSSVSASLAENPNPTINQDTSQATSPQTTETESSFENVAMPESNPQAPAADSSVPTSAVETTSVVAPIETRPVATPLNPTKNVLESQSQRSEDSFKAASSVLSQILGATASLNRGVRTADYLVIKENTAPAILVEMGFVTHPIEGAQLKDLNYLDRIAYGISRGVLEYLDNLPPDTR